MTTVTSNAGRRAAPRAQAHALIPANAPTVGRPSVEPAPVTRLPGAAASPVVQTRTRGRLPHTVVNLHEWRTDRMIGNARRIAEAEARWESAAHNLQAAHAELTALKGTADSRLNTRGG